MTIEKLYSLFLAQGQKITTDTRNISNGQIFFALRGENFDGNQYALEALKNGARYAIVDDPKLSQEQNIIVVDNVLDSLQQLALHHRNVLNIPIIAITGSNGKTTTKELIKDVLSQKFKVAYTKGNLNNHIGIPLTLLDIKPYDDISIVEMGANHVGEIESYCSYVKPNYGLITNIGKAHLEGFGSIEGVIKGKTELYNYLLNSKGVLFVNKDDTILLQKSEESNRVFYSLGTECEYIGEINPVSSSGFLTIDVMDHSIEMTIHTNLAGDYNAANVMSAYCIGRYFDIPPSDIKTAIERYIPTNSRSQIIHKNELTIILDAYNANPSSMEEALKNLANYSKKRVAILGAMKEMGLSSKEEHMKILELAVDLGIESIIAIGIEYANLLKSTNRILYFETTQDAKQWYSSQSWTHEVILLKGSRGMALEKILEDS